MSNEGDRLFECDAYKVQARHNSCFFCDNCTDIFYDYQKGYASPYMWLCIKGNDTEKGMMGVCEDFREERKEGE